MVRCNIFEDNNNICFIALYIPESSQHFEGKKINLKWKIIKELNPIILYNSFSK